MPAAHHEPPPTGEVLRLLDAHRRGDAQAFDRLISLVYADLQRLARRQLKGRGRGRTLDTTSLVHEAYLKLAEGERATWSDRAHFLRVAAIAMRQIVIDYARQRAAQKRGGGEAPLPLSAAEIAIDDQAAGLLELDRALTGLGAIDRRLVEVVECRFFAGLSELETASALGVSASTVERDWRRARAWLRIEMS